MRAKRSQGHCCYTVASACRSHLRPNHPVVNRQKAAEFLLVPILQLVKLNYLTQSAHQPCKLKFSCILVIFTRSTRVRLLKLGNYLKICLFLIIKFSICKGYGYFFKPLRCKQHIAIEQISSKLSTEHRRYIPDCCFEIWQT